MNSWFGNSNKTNPSSTLTKSMEEDIVKVDAPEKEQVTEKSAEEVVKKKDVLLNEVTSLEELCKKMATEFEQKKEEFSKLKIEIESLQPAKEPAKTADSDIINFNIGGSRFAILKANVLKKIKNPKSGQEYEPHKLEALVQETETAIYDSTGAIFIDRNPRFFNYILDYLRQANTEKPFELPKSTKVDAELLDGLYEEAQFYRLLALKALFIGKNIPSKIISASEDVEAFIKLLEPVSSLINPSKPWRLLYRATEDGFEAVNFHRMCDNHPNTIVICKVAETNNVFGGFTSVGWKYAKGYNQDANAFIFSLKNKIGEPELMMCRSSKSAVYYSSEAGPAFGAGDFYIANKSNTSNLSSSRLGNSYGSAKIKDGSYESTSYLAGLSAFLLTEIEVFQEAN